MSLQTHEQEEMLRKVRRLHDLMEELVALLKPAPVANDPPKYVTAVPRPKKASSDSN